MHFWLFSCASATDNVHLQSVSSGRKGEGTPEERGVSKGKSLLVAAIMDLVTTSCEIGDTATGFRPMLPGINIKFTYHCTCEMRLLCSVF